MTAGRLGLLAVALGALPANPCEKPKPIDPVQIEPPPTSTVSPSSTRPPIWAPVDTAPPPKPEVTDLSRAQTALGAKDFKRVRTILEAKVKSGRGTPEEIEVLQNACASLKDKPCLAMIKKAGFQPSQP